MQGPFGVGLEVLDEEDADGLNCFLAHGSRTVTWTDALAVDCERSLIRIA
jgi:hypothetical protein